VAIYNSEGKFQGSFSVPYPVGIAVDASGTIFVGSGASGKREGYRNAVYVFTPDFVQSGALGSGAGELGYPNDIAVSADGKVYVADTQNHVVKVFDPATGAGFSFGGYGSTSGLFKRPTAVALNDNAGEIYVADYPSASRSSTRTASSSAPSASSAT
jgi:sugar lactone lactonase YvrE